MTKKIEITVTGRFAVTRKDTLVLSEKEYHHFMSSSPYEKRDFILQRCSFEPSGGDEKLQNIAMRWNPPE